MRYCLDNSFSGNRFLLRYYDFPLSRFSFPIPSLKEFYHHTMSINERERLKKGSIQVITIITYQMSICASQRILLGTGPAAPRIRISNHVQFHIFHSRRSMSSNLSGKEREKETLGINGKLRFQPDTNAMSEAPSPPSSSPRSADLIRPLINQYLQIKS